jgi:hypothetical protein
MSRWGTPLCVATTVLAVVLGLAAANAPRAQPVGRVVYMAAVEMKGGTQQDKEPNPTGPLPPGGGYVKTPPNAAGRWEASVYHWWSPATIVVQQGEAVTLEIVGINGDVHPSTIPGLAESFVVKWRRNEARIDYVEQLADQRSLPKLPTIRIGASSEEGSIENSHIIPGG